jgi:hypothetical protein
MVRPKASRRGSIDAQAKRWQVMIGPVCGGSPAVIKQIASLAHANARAMTDWGLVDQAATSRNITARVLLTE